MNLSTVFRAASETSEFIEIMKLNWLENRPECALLRQNKNIPVFRVTRPHLNLPVKPSFIRFSGKKFFLCILKGISPFKMHKIIFFLEKK